MLGIKISLPGFDVKTASPEQMALDSDFDTFKVDSTANPPHFGLVEITFNTNPPADIVTTLYSFDHGYGHRPSLMSYIDNGAYGTSSTTGHIHMDVFDLSWIEVNVTDTQLKIDVLQHGSVDFTGADIGSAPNVMSVRFYIFAEDGT